MLGVGFCDAFGEAFYFFGWVVSLASTEHAYMFKHRFSAWRAVYRCYKQFNGALSNVFWPCWVASCCI